MTADMPPSANKLKIAVVGCGVAGLTAAWLLRRKHDVHLFERNNYLGGHTRTRTIPDGPDAGTPVDTAFIVYNERNYPLFARILRELGVETAESSMTFSFFDQANAYGYSGNSLRAFFPKLRHFFKAGHWSLLRDLRRFATVGYRDLRAGHTARKTLGEYCRERGFGEPFLQNYLYPMGAAIWSSPVAEMRNFPAQPYLTFLENHGLLRLHNRPRWRFIPGGGQTYVRAMEKSFEHSPRLNDPPASVRRGEDGVYLKTGDGQSHRFDHVVLGTHADQALRLLEDPGETEQQMLGAWRYQKNTVILHTDENLLPPERKLWSSWNFIRHPARGDARPVTVSYHMNRLQNLRTRRNYIVTLNPAEPIPGEHIIDRVVLKHPLYSFATMAPQKLLRENNGKRNTWFCGSYFGYGFHEDAVRSGVEVARAFDIEL